MILLNFFGIREIYFLKFVKLLKFDLPNYFSPEVQDSNVHENHYDKIIGNKIIKKQIQ